MIFHSDQWHISFLRPSREFAAAVLCETREPTAADQRSDAIIERTHKKSIVATERVPDATDAIRIYLRQALQQIDSPSMVPNSFHGRAQIAVPVGIKPIPAKTLSKRQVRIVGRKR